MVKKLKNLIATTLAVVTMVASLGITTQEVQASESEIKVMVNGEYVKFDEPPILENGIVFVPMRAIFESLGFEVRWDNEFQLVLADLIEDYYLISVRLYSDKMSVGYTEYLKAETYITNHTNNRKKEEMSTNFNSTVNLNPPYKNINGRILVPVRAIAEGSGASVKWDSTTKTVIIDSSNKVITNSETGEKFDVNNAKSRVDSYFNNKGSSNQVENNNSTNNQTSNNNQVSTELTREEKELEIVRLVNIERVNAGLNELEIAGDLMYVARWHSDEMVELDYFSHMSPTYNLQHTKLAEALGADYKYAGENLHGGSYTPEYAMSSWLQSSSHKAHILNPNHKYIGIGYSEGDSEYGAYWSLFMGY